MTDDNREVKWTVEFESNIKQYLAQLATAQTQAGNWFKSLLKVEGGFGGIVEAIKRVTTSTNKAQTAQVDFGKIANASVRELVVLINELATASEMTFGDVAAGMAEMGNITKGQATQAVTAYTEVTGEAEGATSRWAGALGALGGVAQTVLVATIGGSALKAILKIISALREAADVSSKWQFTLVRVEIAVRALQRRIGEAAGSLVEWEGFVTELRETFKVFTTEELREATASILLLTRELNFSEQQVKDLTKATALLALVNGRDMNATITQVIVGLTGYRRGLYRLGVSFQSTDIVNEAMRLGLIETASEMTNAEKAQASLSLILQQTEVMWADAGVAVDTYAGQIRAAEAVTEEATARIGTLFVPVVAFFARMKARVFQGLAGMVGIVEVATVKVVEGFLKMVVGIATVFDLLDSIIKDRSLTLQEHISAITPLFEERMAKLDQTVLKLAQDLQLLPPILEDAAQMAGDLAGALTEAQIAARELSRDIAGDLAEALREHQAAIVDARQDSLEKLLDAQEDYADKLLRLEEDLALALQRLDEDLARRRDELRSDMESRLAEIDEDVQEKREEAAEEFRKKELRAEEDFQRDLERLHTRYVEDLFEALEKRDARAILNIQRRYRTQRQEMVEDYEVAKARRLEDYLDRLADFDAYAADRRAKVLADYEHRLADLERGFQERRDRMLEDYKRRQEDLLKSLKRRRQDIKDAFKEELRDLDTRLAAEIRRIGEHYADMEDASLRGAMSVYRALRDVFGPNELIDELMIAFRNRLIENSRIAVTIETAIGGPAPTGTTGPLPSQPGLIVPTPTGAPPGVGRYHGEAKFYGGVWWWWSVCDQDWFRYYRACIGQLGRAAAGGSVSGGGGSGSSVLDSVPGEATSTATATAARATVAPQRLEIAVHVTADENFSPDFESLLFRELVPPIAQLVAEFTEKG